MLYSFFVAVKVLAYSNMQITCGLLEDIINNTSSYHIAGNIQRVFLEKHHPTSNNLSIKNHPTKVNSSKLNHVTS